MDDKTKKGDKTVGKIDQKKHKIGNKGKWKQKQMTKLLQKWSYGRSEGNKTHLEHKKTQHMRTGRENKYRLQQNTLPCLNKTDVLFSF